jgi:flagellar basal-body rod protein FlgF
VVETPLGPRYTRAGNFSLGEGGQLVTPQGYPVSGAGGPITIGPDDTKINIASDGTISSENGQIGQLQVVEFADPDKLEKVGNSLFRANEQAPLTATNPSVKQGYLEQSNVVPIIEINNMIQIQREFESMQKLLQAEHRRQLDALDKIYGKSS